MSARDDLPPHVQVLGDDQINLPEGDITPRMRTRLTPQRNTPEYRSSHERTFGAYCEMCKRSHKDECGRCKHCGCAVTWHRKDLSCNAAHVYHWPVAPAGTVPCDCPGFEPVDSL